MSPRGENGQLRVCLLEQGILRDPGHFLHEGSRSIYPKSKSKFHQVGCRTASTSWLHSLARSLIWKIVFYLENMQIWELGTRTSDRIPITLSTLGLKTLLSPSYQHKQSYCLRTLSTLVSRTLLTPPGAFICAMIPIILKTHPYTTTTTLPRILQQESDPSTSQGKGVEYSHWPRRTAILKEWKDFMKLNWQKPEEYT